MGICIVRPAFRLAVHILEMIERNYVEVAPGLVIPFRAEVMQVSAPAPTPESVPSLEYTLKFENLFWLPNGIFTGFAA